MAETDAQRKLALIQLEREKRRRAQIAQTETAQPEQTLGDKARGAFEGAGRVAEEINVGMLGMIPGAVPALQGAGLIRPDESAMPGKTGAALRMVGTAAPFAAGIPALGSAPGAIKSSGIIRSFVDDIANFARQRPGTYFGAELGAAGASGAAGEMAREEGAGPAGQLAAEAAGGLIGGGILAAAPAGVRSARESVNATLFPMTEEGGMTRASRQMQARAGGPNRAEELSKMLDTIPEGVTPAQWIGDSRLLAQEARLLADNPDMAPLVRQELQEARLVAQESLRNEFGRPRSRQDWERSVLERVTPQGTRIEPGMTDEMLEQAYNSFSPMYDSVRGEPIDLSGYRSRFPHYYDNMTLSYRQGEVNLSPILERAVFSAEIDSSPAARSEVAGWVNNAAKEYSRRIQDGTIDSGSIIDLRSKIRDRRRSSIKAGNIEKADLYGAADASLGNILYSSLSEEAKNTVMSADSQYRKYKVVENAIFSAGDRNFTPEQLSESIRMGGLTTQSQYARGADESVQELRDLALAGRSTEEVLGDPRRAALFVRGMDDTSKKAVQADFVNTLFDRARGQATDATDAGVPFISGKQLIRDIQENRRVMQALGMGEDEIGRTLRMAREISTLEQKAPTAVAQLFEDGPANLMQLGAALIGAKQGQALAGGGMGSSLVLAQFMSNRARGILARMTSDKAAQLMKDAATDPELYRAMLTKSLSGNRAKEQAAYLESWLLANAVDTRANDIMQDSEGAQQ